MIDTLPPQTPEEIAIDMGFTADKVREIQKISQEPVSLENPVGDEGDSQLGDFIEDSEAVVAVDAVSFTLLQDQLQSVLETLAQLHIDRRDPSKNRLSINDGPLGSIDLTSAALADSLSVDLDRDLPTLSVTLAPGSLTLTGDVVLKVERAAKRDAEAKS